MITNTDRKEYIKFRKFLLNEGFIMMQKSVYSKISMNNTSSNLVKDKLIKNKPKDGIVQLLIITEKQFAGIDYLCGFEQQLILDSMERLIVL
jgi:CRISPR-associated protein Cas2